VRQICVYGAQEKFDCDRASRRLSALGKQRNDSLLRADATSANHAIVAAARGSRFDAARIAESLEKQGVNAILIDVVRSAARARRRPVENSARSMIFFSRRHARALFRF